MREPSHRRGHHLYFAAGGERFKSRAGLRPGLDVRSDTGYVIAASSVGANGAYRCVNDIEPVAVPSWLSAELLQSAKRGIVQSNTVDGDDWVSSEGRVGRRAQRYLHSVGRIFPWQGDVCRSCQNFVARFCRQMLPANGGIREAESC
jgi:hypothetical protein